MSKKYVTIMDVSSSKISVIVGSIGVNGTFLIKGQGESEYAGFYDGEFLEPEKLELAIGLAISNAEMSSGISIDSIFVGTPAEFSYVECLEVENRYDKKTKVEQEELLELYSKAINKDLIKSKVLIACAPIWFMLDDRRKIYTLNRFKTNTIRAKVSLVYIENSFIKFINSILSKLGIKLVEYISTSLAEAKYLLSKNERSKKAVIIDTDYITTSVLEVWGEGLTSLNTFPLGGGHITADLSEEFGLSFSSAEVLKNNIILSISSKRTDCYEINTEDKVLSIPINSANEVVQSRIKIMASLIAKCLKDNYDENSEIYLTGGGLSYINGARDYLAKCLGVNIKLLTPSMPSKSKPHFSGPLSVLSSALRDKSDNKFSWFKNLFRI